MARLKFLILALMLTTILSSLGLPPSAYADELTGSIEYQEHKYLVGPGDVLQVEVFNEPEYSQKEILVRPDGHATFIEVGDLDVNNKSIATITNEIKTRLKRVIIEPEVTVSLISVRPTTLYVRGAVKNPGMIQLATATNDKNVHVQSESAVVRMNTQLSNVLANAGGVMLNADLSNIQVTREHNSPQGNTKQVIHVDLWQMLKAGDKDQDIALLPGDVVYIPELQTMAIPDEDYQVLLRSQLGPKEFPVRVIGEVQNPGVYPLEGTSPYLNSVIARAGGFAPQANHKVVAIRRFTTETSFSTFFMDPNKGDIVLRPNDVVYIAEDKLYKTGRLAQQIANIMAPFQSAASIGSSGAQMFGWGGWNLRGNANR